MKLKVARGDNFSCDEIWIEPGAKIAVHGISRIERDPAPIGEIGFATHLLASGSPVTTHTR